LLPGGRAADERDRLGDHLGRAQDPPVPEPGRGDQPRPGQDVAILSLSVWQVCGSSLPWMTRSGGAGGRAAIEETSKNASGAETAARSGR